jgi:2-polyprenyl-6-methoxyphenol hydroxylase-like FAD-dependent oxidoreductase
VLIGADGIHSVVRDKLFPNEGPPRWNGLMLWRGAIDWPAFLTGRSMSFRIAAMQRVRNPYPRAPGYGLSMRSPDERSEIRDRQRDWNAFLGFPALIR